MRNGKVIPCRVTDVRGIWRMRVTEVERSEDRHRDKTEQCMWYIYSRQLVHDIVLCGIGGRWRDRSREMIIMISFACLCVCVCARARVCVRVCVCACVRACVCVCGVCVWEGSVFFSRMTRRLWTEEAGRPERIEVQCINVLTASKAMCP